MNRTNLLITYLVTLLISITPAYAYEIVNEYVDHDTWAWQQFPDDAQDGQGKTRVGEFMTGYRNWTYLKFDFDDVAIPPNATIDRAKLYIYCSGVLGTSFNYTKAYRVYESTWNESTLTWNNKPNYTTSGAGSTGIATTGWHSIIVTSIVSSWHNQTNPNYGFCLRMTPDELGLLEFDDKSGNRAYLEIKYSLPDTTPPSPSPPDWNIQPYPLGNTSIRMSVLNCVDADSPPVEYFFEFYSGSGGHDSGWIADPVYDDVGLTPNTSYGYRVKARDSATTPNETLSTEPRSTYTHASIPPAPGVGNPTPTTLDVTPAWGDNPLLTELAIYNVTDGCYVQGDGTCAPDEFWHDYHWGTVTVTDLDPGTSYDFQVMARNHNDIPTAFGPIASGTTVDASPLPYLTQQDVSASVITLGDSFVVTARLRNDGGPADNGGISISFGVETTVPEIYRAEVASYTFDSTTLAVEDYTPWDNDTIWDIDQQPMTAQYLLVEGTKANWSEGEEHSLTVTVTPQRTGPFRINVRGWLDSQGAYYGDPDAATDTDQQGYLVHVHEVDVDPSMTGGVTVITHGWQSESGDCSWPNWAQTIAEQIAFRAYGTMLRYVPTTGEWQFTSGTNDSTAEIVLVFDWCDESNEPYIGYAEAAGDALFAALVQPHYSGTAAFDGIDLLDAARSFHFVGHSRGTVVNSQAARRIAEFRPTKELDQITTLDPHPVDGLDPPPYLWDGYYTWADNYYQDEGCVVCGIVIGGAVNRLLGDSLPIFTHSDVHRWYHGTIDLRADDDGTGESILRSLWYSDGQGHLEGAFYSQMGGGWSSRPMDVTPCGGAVTCCPMNPDEYEIAGCFNGDWEEGPYFTLPLSDAGWAYHGGGYSPGTLGAYGEVIGSFGGWGAKLNADGEFVRHNRLYVPADSAVLQYRYRVDGDATGASELHVYWDDGDGSEYMGGVSVDFALPWTDGPAIPLPAGDVGTIEFRLFTTGNADVRIDNIALTPSSPTEPTIYDQPDDTFACDGADASFHIGAYGAGVLHYQWYANGQPVGGDDNDLTLYGLSPADDGTQIRCEVADDNGTAVSDTVTLTVNPNPMASAANSGPVCEDDDVQLTGGPANMASYSWTGPGGFTSTEQSPLVSSASAGDYCLTVTDTNGCISVEVCTTVVIDPLPTATASNNGPVCEAEDVQLVGGPGGMTTYAWTGPSGFTSNEQSPLVSQAVAGEYCLTVTDAGGCASSPACTTVVINASPTATAANNGPVCEGEDVQLIGGPGGMMSYSWTGPGGFTSNEQSPLVSPVLAGEYCLTVTNVNGCSSTPACTTAIVNPAPLTPSNASADPPQVCEGGATNLTASVPGMEIDWYTDACGQGFVDTGDSIVVSPTVTTTYFARSRDPVTECESLDCDSVVVEVLEGGSGDMDGNGEVDIADVPLFVNALLGFGGVSDECDADVCGDGKADGRDVQPFTELLLTGAGADCNSNGVSDVDDIASGTSDDDDLNGTPDECEGAMVAIEGGPFDYQGDHGQSVHVPTFMIDKYEVTNALYCQFLNAADPNGDHYDSRMEISWNSEPGGYAVQAGREIYPIRYVNYYDAEAFAAWRSAEAGETYRLPDQYEWEKAAAWDPELQHYYTYAFQQDTIDCPWCNYNNCVGGVRPVGSYNGTGGTSTARSYYGCYDMSGNVWEWTSELVTTSRVIRGGTFDLGASTCECAHRNPDLPTDRTNTLGFRLVREVAPVEPEMVVIEGSSFDYQNDHGQSIYVPTFMIDKYEVTNASYCRFLNAEDPNGDHYDSNMEIVQTSTPGSYAYVVQGERETYPIRYVSYADAEAYCIWRSAETGDTYRLPTQYEWEKVAAWDPALAHYYTYGFQQDSTIDCSWCNYDSDGSVGSPYCNDGPMPVGSYDGTAQRENAYSHYGCYDMSGNVYEWTSEVVGSNRVIRGGAWDDLAYSCQCTYRNSDPSPSIRNRSIGFRPVREVASAEPVMVEVAGGSFDYQNDPGQSVYVPAVMIGKYEVTNAQYCAFLNAAAPNGGHYDPNMEIVQTGTTGGYSYIVQGGKENHPICWVDHTDAEAYATWLSTETGETYRLPNQFEWEKAAAWHPGLEHYYNYAFQQDTTISCAWCNCYLDGSYCVGHTTPVGYYDGTGGRALAESYYGCYDMSGNVREWTSESTGANFVVRGGSFADFQALCACSNDDYSYSPSWRNINLGFRLVREIADCNSNGIADEYELDSDSDGVIDECEDCPFDPNKTSAGECGCGNPEIPGCPNSPPDAPVLLSPPNGATFVGQTPTLTTDAFSDPNLEDTFGGTWWQISSTDNFAATVWHLGPTAPAVTEVSITTGILQMDHSYYWRVRHQDNHNAWSDWSQVSQFSTGQ